jgi:hypothetical protein
MERVKVKLPPVWVLTNLINGDHTVRFYKPDGYDTTKWAVTEMVPKEEKEIKNEQN